MLSPTASSVVRFPAESSLYSWMPAPVALKNSTCTGAVPRAGPYILLLGTGDHGAGRIIAIRAEDGVLGLAIRPQQQPKLGKTIGELHAIEVVTAGTNTAKEDRLHCTERVEHRLHFASVAANSAPSDALIRS